MTKHKVPYCDCSGAFYAFRACSNRRHYNSPTVAEHPHKPAHSEAPTTIDPHKPEHCAFCGHSVYFEFDCTAFCECNRGAIEFEDLEPNMPLYPTEPIRNRCGYCGGLVLWQRPSRDKSKEARRA